MRARPRLLRAALCSSLVAFAGALVTLWTTKANATPCGAPLVSTCIDDDHLWPHAGLSHFISIGATETLAAGQVGFGLATTYLSRPLSLSTATPGPGGSLDAVIDNQVNASFLWSYGVTNHLELDLVLPVTFGQSGSGGSAVTGASPQNALSNTATRDLRFGFAYTLIAREPVDPYAAIAHGRGNGVGLAGRFEVSAPTGDTGEFASNGTAVFIPGISADYRYDRLLVGAELGARLRPTQEFEGGRIGSQAFLALGASVDLLPSELFTLGAEAFFLPTFAEQHSTDTVTGVHGIESVPNGQYITPAEWMLSARTAPLFGGAFQIQLAGGGPIPFSTDEITNPRFRFTLSVRYAREWRDTDGDGVADSDDKCPFVRGIPDNPAGNGCPPSATTERIDLSAVPIESPPPPVVPPLAHPPTPQEPGGHPVAVPVPEPTPARLPDDGTSQSK
jgi:OOP family OmpA-OmpF porin